MTFSLCNHLISHLFWQWLFFFRQKTYSDGFLKLHESRLMIKKKITITLPPHVLILRLYECLSMFKLQTFTFFTKLKQVMKSNLCLLFLSCSFSYVSLFSKDVQLYSFRNRHQSCCVWFCFCVYVCVYWEHSYNNDIKDTKALMVLLGFCAI